MEIQDWPATAHLNQLYRDIRRLGLETNVAELEAFGFTVLEGLLPKETLETARNAIVEICEQQTGKKPDFDSGAAHPNWRLVPYLMPRREVFQEILLNEKMLALITYLLGEGCQLSSMTCHFKGPGEGGELGLHSDTPMINPLPAYSNIANANYALTDYTKEGGCLAVVPGSHRRARNPESTETGLAGERENPDAIPVEVPAGSCVIWHGNLWHGSYPRTVPGLRLNLATYFVAPWMKVQERYGRDLPPEVIERHANNPRFAQLVGLNEMMGWQEEGPAFLDMVNGGVNPEMAAR